MVYEFNDQALRTQLWRDIRNITNQMVGAWAIMSDFNSILNEEDRVGSKVSCSVIKDFRECVEQSGLKELKSSGCFYTWSNKQDRQDGVLSRIDRVFINVDWVNRLPASEVYYMHAGLYDHSPAVIRWEGTSPSRMRILKYYNIWNMDKSFKERVMFKIVGKLNRLKKVLLKLNKEKFAEVEKQEEESMKKLVECQEKIQKDPRNEFLIKEEKDLTHQCIYWKKEKIEYMQQKSKEQWLKYGDMDIKYFRFVIKAKRAASRIFTIQNMQGETVHSIEAIAEAFIEFYTSLLGTDQQCRDHVKSHVVKESQIVSEEQRVQLVSAF
ncbi:uncharacterized protein LOC142174362 [Nicotiana tabacum]|uniref:Uncharacterized protein LOC142174362 n=1 Tax=Nicotiana tabacum TaxID=4097 RepID=A0AC58TG89_TOBAC